MAIFNNDLEVSYRDNSNVIRFTYTLTGCRLKIPDKEKNLTNNLVIFCEGIIASLNKENYPKTLRGVIIVDYINKILHLHLWNDRCDIKAEPVKRFIEYF